MFFVVYYLVRLLIAPQQWVPFMLGWRVDFFLYPAWIIYAVASGRLAKRFPLSAIVILPLPTLPIISSPNVFALLALVIT